MSIRWFRRWLWLAVALRLTRKRAFLRWVMTVDDALSPLWNFWFYAKRPLLWFQVRRLLRLHRMGITEVAL